MNNIDALIRQLRFGSPKERIAAAEAVGELGDPRAVPPLLKNLILSDEEEVRIAIVKALGKIGDLQAVPHLIQALGDKKWEVRKYAALALGNLGDPQAVEPLTHALNDSYEKVREAAAEALGKLGDKAAAEALRRFLITHPDAILTLSLSDIHAAEHAVQQLLHERIRQELRN